MRRLLHHPLRDAIVLAALILFEALLLHAHYQREYAWHQPQHYDQAGILMQSYELEQRMLNEGIAALGTYLRRTPMANGLAAPIEGAVVALVTGGARLPRLALNFLFLVALQIVAFKTARSLLGGARWGYALLGLLMLQRSLWRDPGGIFDFRFDMMAQCLFGIWCCAVLRARTLLDARRAAVAVGCGILLCLHRTIASVYLVAILVAWSMACSAAARGLRHLDSGLASAMRLRVRHAAWSLAGFLLAMLPLVAWQYAPIRDYYLHAHVLGAEPLARAQEQGIQTLLDHLVWYPRSLTKAHLGNAFGIGTALLLGAAMLLARRPARPALTLVPLGFLLLAIAVPVAILTVDVSKSPVVAGIAAVPAALAVVVAASGLARPGHWAMAALAGLLFAGGTGVTFLRGARHTPYYANREELRAVAELNQWLLELAAREGWDKVVLSADIMSPAFNGSAIGALGYERTGEFRLVDMSLGGRVRAVTAQEAAAQIGASQVLVLTDRAGSGVLPFDRSIASLRQALDAIAVRDWVQVRTLTLPHDRYRIFVRPEVAARLAQP